MQVSEKGRHYGAWEEFAAEIRDLEKKKMIFLAEDLMREILLRLPIKSLVRFRCVCRAWNTLIQELSFADLHLIHSKQNPCDTLITFPENPSSICLLNIDSSIDTYELGVTPRFKPLPNASTSIISCNGLLLYTVNHCPYIPQDVLHVYNPITKQYLCLPKSPLQSMPWSCYGIGFHAAMKEYKVVRISQQGEIPQDEAEIWTLGYSTSWRRIGKIPYSISARSYCVFFSRSAGFFVQGALHWWMTCDKMTIVSMNMESEKFCAIELPFRFNVEMMGDEDNQMMEMIEWNGRLAVVQGIPEAPYSWDIWVLKDYPREEEGKTVSWSKELSFDWEESPSFVRCGWFHPLCVQKNGEILVLAVIDNVLLSYNMEKTSFTHIKSLPSDVTFYSYISHSLVNYVPSLVGWKQELEKKKDQVQYKEAEASGQHESSYIDTPSTPKCPHRADQDRPFIPDSAAFGGERVGAQA